MEGVFLMVDAAKRQRFGTVVREKRKKLGIDQLQLGLEIWGKQGLSPSAAQTRVSRIERGDYWPPREDIYKIIDHLNIWDKAFEGSGEELNDPEGLVLDPAWEKYIPGLRNMLRMMSDFARKGDALHFYQMLQMMCDVAQAEREKASNGGP